MTAFHNKSVLVLGGSRGIGAAIVRRFVADGASVVFSYSGSPEAAERLAAETGSTAVQADNVRAAVVFQPKINRNCHGITLHCVVKRHHPGMTQRVGPVTGRRLPAAPD